MRDRRLQPDPRLEAFIDESTRRCWKHSYYPKEFENMRKRLGTEEAMERLVKSEEMRNGFLRLQEQGLLGWSIESAICSFPHRFSTAAIARARFRLTNANAPGRSAPGGARRNLPS
jgi:hypothetical protein